MASTMMSVSGLLAVCLVFVISVRFDRAMAERSGSNYHDPEMVHTVHKTLHFLSRLKSHLQQRGVGFRGNDGAPTRARRDADASSSPAQERKSRFTLKQKEHAMSILQAMDDSVSSAEKRLRKQVLTNALRYSPDAVLSLLPARGRVTTQGCRVTFSMHELDGKPSDAVRHARLHLPCTGGDCELTSNDINVRLSERMQRKCVQRNNARAAVQAAESSQENHRLRRSANRTQTTESFSQGWNALDITDSIQDIHPCDTQKAELFLTGKAMDNVDCSSAVFLLTSTQMTPLASSQGNLSTLTNSELDAVAHAAEEHVANERRRRREVRLSPDACQLRACNISFHRLDWLFVVFPRYLDIKTCRGDCLPLTQFPSDDQKPPVVTNNVVIRHWYRIKVAQHGGQKVSPPHCVPIKYESATIGYALEEIQGSFDPHTMKMETLPEIKANRCGCR